MKLTNKVAKKIVNVAAATVVLGMSVANSALAAGVDISTETASAKTDIATAGGLIIGVVVSIAVIGWIRRVIR